MKKLRDITGSIGVKSMATLVLLLFSQFAPIAPVFARNLPPLPTMYYINGALLTAPKVASNFKVTASRTGYSQTITTATTSYQVSYLAAGTYTLTAWRDSDGDSVQDSWEEYGSRSGVGLPGSRTGQDISMTAPDNDADGMPDWWEYEYFGNTTNELFLGDWDSDGLMNLEEYQLGTNPNSMDSDLDGMGDGWEVAYGLDPTYAGDAYIDSDGDGVYNVWEFQRGPSNPTSAASLPDMTPDIYVSTAGSDSSTAYDDPLTPLASIKMALLLSQPNDIIQLEDGTYDGPDNRGLVFPAHRVILRSSGGADNCVIDCENLDRAFSLDNAQIVNVGNNGTLIEGLSIINGHAAIGQGGGINAVNVTVLIIDCKIGGCWGSAGGAINMNTTPYSVISGCEIADCVASGYGGGVRLFRGSSARIESTMIVGNTSGIGGAGLETEDSPGLEIINCTIADNIASNSYGAGINFESCYGATIRNTILFGNRYVYNSYSIGRQILANMLAAAASGIIDVSTTCIEGGEDGVFGLNKWKVVVRPDCITNNPQFYPGTYRLSPTSPCIDQGVNIANYTDLDGEAAWDSPTHTNNGTSFIDIGADEWVGADTDNDGMPDWWELLYFGSTTVALPSEDSDGDGLTNLEEYLAGANPLKADTDEDGLPDGYEVHHGLDPLNPADVLLDNDGDGLSNLDEYRNGTDPGNRDSDGDGLSDRDDIHPNAAPTNAALGTVWINSGSNPSGALKLQISFNTNDLSIVGVGNAGEMAPSELCLGQYTASSLTVTYLQSLATNSPTGWKALVKVLFQKTSPGASLTNVQVNAGSVLKSAADGSNAVHSAWITVTNLP